ncbi:MAG TPA: hypothetical protein VH062_09605 [Polyangiaceae bacterium]|jgi:hypothetical protein|nr:hypothetical protein [Polyangiaceae bacterium]
MNRGTLLRFVCTLFMVGGSVIALDSCSSDGSVIRNGKGHNGGGSSLDASADGPAVGVIHFDAGGVARGNDCKPKTCADLGYGCGPNSDGCGNVIQCGTCSGNDYCGGGGYSMCGNPLALPDGAVKSTCVPKTCADFPSKTCGQQSDGCGSLTDDCATCKTGFCGGGGPSLCGTGATGGMSGADGSICVPKTCADYPTGTCGKQSDGCGALTPDCTTCKNPEFCGGDIAHPNTCGGNNGLGVDGGPAKTPCSPKACSDFPTGTCGVQGDGCGGQTPNCSACTSPAFCGGGGKSLCGTGTGTGPGGGTCTPKTCAAYPGTCGQQSNGCGGLTPNCGTCTNPTFCGGGGKAGVCGGNNGKQADGGVVSHCVPATCQSLGYTCGQAADGCGGVIGPCGPACVAPEVCGGAPGKPNQCGSSIPCTGLCLQQPTCTGGVTTTLTGTVRAGLQESAVNGNKVFYVPQGTTPDPVPGVLVYVPNSALTPFANDPTKPQVECSQCGSDVSGAPLVTTTTDFNGKFTLQNVPVSKNAADTIPVVIQLGHWRRVFHFAVTKSCAPNAAPQDLNFPSTSTEGDIPLTAISTGSYDPIECVLLKMGVAQQEFTSLPTWKAEAAAGTTPKPGRVHVYTATAGNGGNANPGSVLAPQQDESVLMGTGNAGGPANGTYMMYDQILLPCWGDAVQKTGSELANLGYYGDHGGHFFATHYSYSWLNANTNSALSSIANWDPKANQNDFPTANGIPFTGNVSTAVPVTVPATNPGTFVKWLNLVGALANGNPAGAPPAAPTVTLTAARHDVDSVRGPSVDWIDGTDPAPKAGSASQMQLHFTFDMPIATGNTTPTQCGHGIFSDFHVNSVTRSNGTMFPNECSDRAVMDSQQKILEYMIFDLASCVPPPPTSSCTPKKCSDLPAGTCGQQGDGCGGLTANCGSCPTGQVCGGAGTPNKCGNGGGGSCTPTTCAAFAGSCGQQSDGCGGVTANCTCPAGQTCGGGGVGGKCGTPNQSTCTKLTCAAYPAGTCGEQSDGCGGLTADCNPCPTGQTCGGCGVPGQCCTPPITTCMAQPCPASVECGPSSDGCGGVIASCGTCTPPETCGGGGDPGKCGGSSSCKPQTCSDQGLSCGPAGDGCGNLIQSCGKCTPPDTCGGAGKPGECGHTVQCVPKTCQDLNITCGPAGDGCGGLIPTCGTCNPPQTCGGGGTPGQCGGGGIK